MTASCHQWQQNQSNLLASFARYQLGSVIKTGSRLLSSVAFAAMTSRFWCTRIRLITYTVGLLSPAGYWRLLKDITLLFPSAGGGSGLGYTGRYGMCRELCHFSLTLSRMPANRHGDRDRTFLGQILLPHSRQLLLHHLPRYNVPWDAFILFLMARVPFWPLQRSVHVTCAPELMDEYLRFQYLPSFSGRRE